jgi:hypothetical protein
MRVSNPPLLLRHPGENHDLSVTTEHESAAIESGATDASRPAGFIRACRLLLDGLGIPLQQETVVPRTPLLLRPGTDEPSAHPWHQISSSRCTKGWNFQVKAGIQVCQNHLDPGFGQGAGHVTSIFSGSLVAGSRLRVSEFQACWS